MLNFFSHHPHRAAVSLGEKISIFIRFFTFLLLLLLLGKKMCSCCCHDIFTHEIPKILQFFLALSHPLPQSWNSIHHRTLAKPLFPFVSISPSFAQTVIESARLSLRCLFLSSVYNENFKTVVGVVLHHDKCEVRAREWVSWVRNLK